MIKRIGSVVLALLLASVASAQTPQRGRLSANGAFGGDVTGLSTASITVSDTYSGTVNFEVVGGPGTAAVTVDCATFAAPTTAVNSTTSTGTWVCPVAGATVLQARMSSYVSGTAVIDIVSAAAPGQSVGGAGGVGGGDASEAKQDAQIVQETAIADGVGATGDAAATAGSVGSVNAKLRFVTTQLAGLLTTAQFQTAFGSGSVVTADPCDGGTKVVITVNQTADAELFAGTASNRTYICSILLRQPATSTQTFNLVSGTGTTCGTSVGPVIGGTTAAHGSASTFTLGDGGGTVAKTDTNADNVCLLQSTTDRITGVITYVVAP